MDKCPFCGMIGCESHFINEDYGLVYFAKDCALRQLVQKVDKIANLKERLEAWRKHWIMDHSYETEWSPAIKKLKNLGEI